MIETIKDLTVRAGGNPGSMTCLLELISAPEDKLMRSIEIIQRLDEYGIHGGQIYILWNDLADRNLDRMRDLLWNYPSDLIKEAVGYQDRRGQAMIRRFETQKSEE